MSNYKEPTQAVIALIEGTLSKARKNIKVKIVERLIIWWKLQQARKAAKKYNLDFELRCVFNHQIPYISAGKGIVKVPMESGKTGLYKANITEFLGNTGQKNWKFEFVGYDTEGELK